LNVFGVGTRRQNGPSRDGLGAVVLARHSEPLAEGDILISRTAVADEARGAFIVPVAVALTHLAKPIVPGAPPNWGEELIVVVGYSHRQVDVAYPYG
jgi:hypothetical protein